MWTDEEQEAIKLTEEVLYIATNELLAQRNRAEYMENIASKFRARCEALLAEIDELEARADDLADKVNELETRADIYVEDTTEGTIEGLRTITVDFDVEEDGRFIASVRELPGVMRYGRTKSEAFDLVTKLAVEVLLNAERGT